MPSVLPRVLIIGDSISIGYTPHVAEMLAGKATVIRNVGNGGDSGNVLCNLGEWTAGQWDLIHLNCGLHDLKRPKGTLTRVNTLATYEQNLRAIFSQLTQRPNTKLIWATTTPVIDERHRTRKMEIDRSQSDVLAYNAVATPMAQSFGIPVTDLHAVVLANDPEALITPDGVHYTAPAYRLLAQSVAAGITAVLGL